jgi:hypothetical protein
MTIERCKYCNSTELVEMRDNNLFCLSCQKITKPEALPIITPTTTDTDGYLFQILYQEPKESFEATI